MEYPRQYPKWRLPFHQLVHNNFVHFSWLLGELEISYRVEVALCNGRIIFNLKSREVWEILVDKYGLG